MPMTSDSFMIISSSPSRRTSVPDHFPNSTRSPVLTSSGCTFPSSPRAPGPTAITSPSIGFSWAVSGMMIPPVDFASCSTRRISRRECYQHPARPYPLQEHVTSPRQRGLAPFDFLREWPCRADAELWCETCRCRQSPVPRDARCRRCRSQRGLKPHFSLEWSPPDRLSIPANGTVGREPAHSGNIHDSGLGPRVLPVPQLIELPLRVKVIYKIGRNHVVVGIPHRLGQLIETMRMVGRKDAGANRIERAGERR